jgi:DNA-binding MarR family transcriptional regulator
MVVMISIAQNTIHKIIRKELKKIGLTPEQGAALIGIYALGNNTTAAELSRFSLREPPSTTIILKRLEKQGLISKNGDAHRKNISRISLTEKGIKYYRKALKIHALDRVFNKLSKEKRMKLWSLLDEFKKQAFKELNIDQKAHAKYFGKLLDLQ